MKLRYIALAVVAFLALPVIAPYADDGLKTSPLSLLSRVNTWIAGQTVSLSSQTFNSDTSAALKVTDGTTTTKKIYFGFDTALNVGFVGCTNSGVSFLPCIVAPFSSLGIGISTAPIAGVAADIGGDVAITKVTASGAAPGATKGKFELVAGTTTGTCKLIIYAGTSTTALTILDNIGAGC